LFVPLLFQFVVQCKGPTILNGVQVTGKRELRDNDTIVVNDRVLIWGAPNHEAPAPATPQSRKSMSAVKKSPAKKLVKPVKRLSLPSVGEKADAKGRKSVPKNMAISTVSYLGAKKMLGGSAVRFGTPKNTPGTPKVLKSAIKKTQETATPKRAAPVRFLAFF